MASIVLGIAGNVVAPGFGGAIGGAIGSVIDNALLFGHHTQHHKPSPYDLTVISSTYGRPIPEVYGRCKVGGNIIMSSLLQANEVSTGGGGGKSGGKGGGKSSGTTETDYSVTCAVAICRGPITNLWRVFADSKLIFDQQPGEGPAFASGLNPEIVPLSQYTSLGDYGATLSFSQGSLNKGQNPSIPSGNGTVYYGTEDQPQDPDMQALIVQTYGSGFEAPAYRGIAYVVFTNFPLQFFGNRVPNFTFEVNGAPTGSTPFYSVGTIIQDVCTKCGIPSNRVDTSALNDAVLGYPVTNEASGRVVIEPLQELFLFDLVEQNDKLTAKYRLVAAENPALSVPETDLGARAEPQGGPGLDPIPKMTRQRRQELDLPQRLSIRYRSASGNAQVSEFAFEIGTVYAQRNRSAVNTGTKITYDTSIVMNDGAATACASQALRLAYANKTAFDFTLPPPYIGLDPGDAVTVNWTSVGGQPRSALVYIQQVEIGADLMVHITGVSTEPRTPDIGGAPPMIPGAETGVSAPVDSSGGDSGGGDIQVPSVDMGGDNGGDNGPGVGSDGLDSTDDNTSDNTDNSDSVDSSDNTDSSDGQAGSPGADSSGTADGSDGTGSDGSSGDSGGDGGDGDSGL